MIKESTRMTSKASRRCRTILFDVCWANWSPIA